MSQTRRGNDLARCPLQIQILSLPYPLTALGRYLAHINDRESYPEAQARFAILCIKGQAFLGTGIGFNAAHTRQHQIDLRTGDVSMAGVLTAALAALVWNIPKSISGKDPAAR